MKIKFLRDELFESEGRNQGHLFRQDEEYLVTRAFGDRWTRRGAVEVLDEKGEPGKDEGAFKLVKAVAESSEAEESEAAKRARKGAAARRPATSKPKAQAAASDAGPKSDEPKTDDPKPAELPLAGQTSTPGA